MDCLDPSLGRRPETPREGEIECRKPPKAGVSERHDRRQQTDAAQDPKAKAEQRDPRGRFVRGHAKRGGRRPGSLNKGGRKAAFRELVAAALDSQAEGKDPRQAVGAVIVNGLLQKSTSKSLPYVKLLLQYGADRPKIQDGTPSGPGRVALAHERDRHWVGAHAVARDATGGVGDADEAGLRTRAVAAQSSRRPPWPSLWPASDPLAASNHNA
jgi:hypothetical protein